jgi:hypothetical protein
VAVQLLVLVAPMIPAPAEAPADYWAHTRYEEEVRDRYDDALALFYQDVPPELAAEALKRAPAQSEARLGEPSPMAVTATRTAAPASAQLFRITSNTPR